MFGTVVTGFVNRFRSILPRDEQFVDNFIAHSTLVVEAAEEFRRMLCGDGKFDEHLAKVCDLENRADDITRDTLRGIHRTFITPFGRTDIRDMISCLDDIVDIMKTSGKRIRLRGITTFTPEMQGMCDKIVSCTKLIHKALPMLNNINKNFVDIISLCEDIKRLEGEADDLNELGLQKIWESDSQISVGTKLLLENLYDLIESVVDKCEDTADVIAGIVEEQV